MSQTALSDSVSPSSASPSSVSQNSVSQNSDSSDSASPDSASALRERVARTVGLLLPKVLGREIPPVREDAPLFDEIGLDSATTLELILELEDEMAAQIDVEQITQDDLVTLGTLVDFLAGHVVEE